MSKGEIAALAHALAACIFVFVMIRMFGLRPRTWISTLAGISAFVAVVLNAIAAAVLAGAPFWSQ